MIPKRVCRRTDRAKFCNLICRAQFCPFVHFVMPILRAYNADICAL
jgi:hypothetical protein